MYCLVYLSAGRARTGCMKMSNRQVTCLLFVAILSIPFVSIYIGYAIGVYMMPSRIALPDAGVIIGPLKLNYSWYVRGLSWMSNQYIFHGFQFFCSLAQ